jgi:hypothetical protein
MSVFIKFNREEIEAMMLQVKTMKNSLINLNSYGIEKKNELKEKTDVLNRTSIFINQAHENLQQIIAMMPQIDSVPIKNKEIISGNIKRKEISISKENPESALEKLKGKISELR